MCFYWCFRGYQLELYSTDIGRELPFVVATSCWNFIIIQFPICMQIKHFSDIQCLISNQFQDIWTETRMILFTTLCFWQIISGKIRKPLISVSCFVFFVFFYRSFIFNQLSGQFTNNSASECCRRGEQATSNSRCSLQSRQGWFITLSALLIAVYKELIELSIHISAGSLLASIPGDYVIAGAGSLQELLGLDRPR